MRNVTKNGYVYILTNKNNTTLYTGVTSELKKRIYEHREKLVEGFTKKFNLSKLVYYEVSESILTAIEREKQIKNFSRQKKMALVRTENSEWRDLYEEL